MYDEILEKSIVAFEKEFENVALSLDNYNHDIQSNDPYLKMSASKLGYLFGLQLIGGMYFLFKKQGYTTEQLINRLERREELKEAIIEFKKLQGASL